MKGFFKALVLASTLASASSAQVPQPDPFAQLRAAYAKRDAQAAAAAYTPDAEVIYRYAGTPEERHKGRDAIARSFQSLLDQIDPADKIDLNFRVTQRSGPQVQGVYRLSYGYGKVSEGRFDVTLSSDGRFASDLSLDAPRDAFEEAAGPVMLAVDDETLDRSFYSRMAGRYRLPDGCILIVTRSIVRLFVRNSCTNEWRGLARVSGREWTAGSTILPDGVAATYRFAAFAEDASPLVSITTPKGETIAARADAYRTKAISFASADGTKLTGTLYVPTGSTQRRPASVMLHGSGPQDRDGYASIIAVLADQLAESGRVVLAYDKRGSGGSGGNGVRAGFDTLGADARAAMAFLAGRPEVDPAHIGLAGSSQAGWVAAKAIADGAKPADVLLLGAAGAAMTVAEQNLYNTQVRMQCAGNPIADIALALEQQAAFFAFLRDPAKASQLDSLTARARLRPGLSDWLFPDSASTDRTAGAWYVVLDPAFDPLPVWKTYRGRTLFLFSEFDDSTPTAEAVKRLRRIGVKTATLAKAQHLGLATTDMCSSELGKLVKFAPPLMPAISRFAKGHT